MMPARWMNCINNYEHENINAFIKTYPELGHVHPTEVKRELVEFFKQNLN